MIILVAFGIVMQSFFYSMRVCKSDYHVTFYLICRSGMQLVVKE
jgi:hypothetical protein